MDVYELSKPNQVPPVGGGGGILSPPLLPRKFVVVNNVISAAAIPTPTAVVRLRENSRSRARDTSMLGTVRGSPDHLFIWPLRYVTDET